MVVSGDYRELTTPEEREEALSLVDAWKHPLIPERQWLANGTVWDQMRAPDGYRRVAPFRAFVAALERTGLPKDDPALRLLEVGCSSGYYHEVLRRAGWSWTYVGIDYSVAFQEFAAQVLPHVTVEVGDACALPYADRSFDVVVSGGCLPHIRDWRAAMAEAARVSSGYVLFHRTPLLASKPTTYWLKQAYDIPCFEIWFNRAEFMGEAAKLGLVPVGAEAIFETAELGGRGQYSLLFQKRR